MGWRIRRFDTYGEAARFIERMEGKYQCEMCLLNDGYGVEYRRLRRVM